MTNTWYFTSESVTEGHPDKIADQISDAILDEILKQDSQAKVAVETLLGKGLVVLAGEITTTATVSVDEIAREVICSIGYDRAKYGLDGHSLAVMNAIIPQSPEIAGGVFNALEGRIAAGAKDDREKENQQGAGDQGIIFGYANNDNTSYHPTAGKLAHLLTEKLAHVRKYGNGRGLLLPDGKAQVTLKYVDGYPVAIENVLVSTQHTSKTSLKAVQDFVKSNIIIPVIEQYNNERVFGAELFDERNYLINPAGSWNIGASAADSGLTGRKIIVDSYQGYARHGGGAYSGKDPSKVDRSAAYYLRYITKNLVAAGAADELELQISYAIGKAEPLSIYVDTKNKPNVGKNVIEGIIRELFDFRPAAYIKELQLKEYTNYLTSAKNGHFGNEEKQFPWERLDKVESVKEFL